MSFLLLLKQISEAFYEQTCRIFHEASWSAVAAILIAGVLSFLSMPKLEDPAISAKQAMVVISYPGASAHEVELNAAIRM